MTRVAALLMCFVCCSGSHDPIFRQALQITAPKAYDADVRLALYDADQDDRLENAELIGEIVVKASQLASGATHTLQLEKNGKAVTDAFIIVNGTGERKSKTPVIKFQVAVAAK